MKFVHPQTEAVFQWTSAAIPSLVIENQRLFRSFLGDIWAAANGEDSLAILSVGNRPVNMSQYAEVVVDFIGFELNKKPLLNKVCGALERVAVDSVHYLETQKLLADIENSVTEWGFQFPCDIAATKISVSALLRSVGIELRDDYFGEQGELERILDYMELVREFDRDKVFFMVNMRSYYSDELIECFLKTALGHEYKVFLLESSTRPMLKGERRITIDGDLCEF